MKIYKIYLDIKNNKMGLFESFDSWKIKMLGDYIHQNYLKWNIEKLILTKIKESNINLLIYSKDFKIYGVWVE